MATERGTDVAATFPPYAPIGPGSAFAERVRALICEIPPGRVTTYGALASAAGSPGFAREVGRLLKTMPHGVPTHRVVTVKGEVLCSRARGTEDDQRHRLASEGVTFDARGRVPLTRYLWTPHSPSPGVPSAV